MEAAYYASWSSKGPGPWHAQVTLQSAAGRWHIVRRWTSDEIDKAEAAAIMLAARLGHMPHPDLVAAFVDRPGRDVMRVPVDELDAWLRTAGAQLTLWR
jgi:hypothetical protein